MAYTVATRDLKVGMFVADLDRPWLETPFPIQGFLIEHESQIILLQRYCRTVEVAPEHSVSVFFTPVSPIPAPPPPPRADADFLALAAAIREGRLPRPAARPQVRALDRRSPLEEELAYSALVIEDVQASLQALTESVHAEQPLDLEKVTAQVAEMAQAVGRNPEAVLWLTRLKSTDEYSYDHAIDVSVHLMVFARFLGLSSRQVECLGVAGLMQDVGKAHLPPDILHKPAPLTAEEAELARSHVAGSLEILFSQPGTDPGLLEIVSRHHERVDGSGYPRRLNGQSIGLLAELAGLVDTYCAMIRERVYRKPLSCQRALAELTHLRGRQFRESLVDQFIQCMGLYPIGTLVELNSGEVAVVLQQNQVRRLQPRVLVLLGPDKSVERYPRTLDLMLEPATATGAPYRIVQALPENAYGIDPRDFYLA